MPLQDVTVTINVAYPAPRIGLGVPAIFEQKTGVSTYQEYISLEALEIDFENSTDAYAKAAVVFAQTDRPEKVVVITYDADITAAMEEHFNGAWHFALIANDLPADQLKAADFIGTKDFKFVVAQVVDTAGRTALQDKKRTIIFDHFVSGEHLDAAAVGGIASLPVGSVTWKFKELKGVSPRYLTADEITDLDNDNTIAYVMKSGKAQTSEGFLANGEYIDEVHGQDWVKVDMENEVQYAMQQSGKLPYDQRGISVIEAAATTSLKRGFNNGIIALTADGLPDFTVSALPREQTDVQDRAARIYRGLSFAFTRAGAIHEVRVSGSINI
ncbi:DUF3383 domain-containing protein [Metabacillus idriensis]|uniref:DUF3383 family protein n=1 Tax=Metabacillus idriensis TaxID=324768 RepID=UPI00203AD797|nr:DUF3383 family protein [Metabacillus idriensis]MCM3598714.1 DUF3383 domain-containing protein [Metabacillus idriensis]